MKHVLTPRIPLWPLRSPAGRADTAEGHRQGRVRATRLRFGLPVTGPGFSRGHFRPVQTLCSPTPSRAVLGSASASFTDGKPDSEQPQGPVPQGPLPLPPLQPDRRPALLQP